MAGFIACAGSGRVCTFRHASTLAHPAYFDPFADENLAKLLERKCRNRLAISRSGRRYRRLARVFRRRPVSVTWPVNESPSSDNVLRLARDIIAGRNPNRVVYEVKTLRKSREGHEHRAIVSFPLADAVVQTAAARHLADVVDADLMGCSWSGRSTGSTRGRATHHDAAAALRAFRLRHGTTPLCVARLDIKAFFDTLAHSLVCSAILEAQERAAERGVVMDSRVLPIVERLLSSYAFGPNVIVAATPLLKQKDPEGAFSWPYEKIAKLCADPLVARIGLPQGSPLSEIIGNLILHAVDVAVVGSGSDPELHFGRFVDDLVVVHPDRSLCEAALARALAALKQLRLIPHERRQFGCAEKAYWQSKGLAVSPWAPRGVGREWVGFLGYELRFDGQVRIRRSTVQRHKERLVGMVDECMQEFDAQLAEAGNSARDWFTAHAARSIANVEKELVRSGTGGRYSWAGCFRLPLKGPWIERQAKELDRFRRLQLSRYRKHVEQHGTSLGVRLTKPRLLLNHYPTSYHFTLVARFARLAIVALVVLGNAHADKLAAVASLVGVAHAS
jgi:hypothetical protein